MARGFDSKSVTDQQEEAERRQQARDPRAPASSPRRRTLELARLDLLRRMDAAPEGHKSNLQAALAALDDLISKA
jgi:hypothetical protein